MGHAGAAPRTEARASVKFYSDRNAKVVSRRVNDAERRLDTLTRDQLRKPPGSLRFRGLEPGRVAAGGARREFTGPVLALSAAGVDGRLTPTDLTVSAGERWLVTGANGTGKSTLMALIAGRLAPATGTLALAPGLRGGLLGQDDELLAADSAGAMTVREAYAAAVGADRAEQVPLSGLGLCRP